VTRAALSAAPPVAAEAWSHAPARMSPGPAPGSTVPTAAS